MNMQDENKIYRFIYYIHLYIVLFGVKMLFEVLLKDKVKMSTDQLSCIYDYDMLKSLKTAGYTFKIKGINATIKEVKSLQIAD